MCSIFFNIYRTKLNEEHFSSGIIIIIQFLDKSYQETNFESYLNSVPFCK